MTVDAFLGRELFWAGAFACLVESAFFVTLTLAGANRAQVHSVEQPAPEARAIAVKPVIDDLPLLKLGGKRVKPKLPDMWVKQAPVKRFEERSAPSPQAKKTPEAVSTAKLATRDAEAPPPDAEIAKKVDETLTDAAAPEPPNVSGEGAPDGVKNGTETDPLKARALSLYRAKIIGWFNARFTPPTGQVPCEELHGLSSSVQVTVGGDRVIADYTITRPSNNPIFDARVKSTLDAMVGQELPPPPPLYPDLTPGTLIQPTLSGKATPCD